MEQRINPIEVSDDEAATIAAHVKRLQESEPGLTAEVLLARMTHKIVRGWNDQAVEANRQTLATSVIDAMRTATPEKVRRAIEVLTTDDVAVGVGVRR